MASYNRIILMGNLTRDPELSYLPSQTPLVKFGLAVNNSYKKKDGTQVEDTLFIDCTAFGPRAETISKHFEKGKPILIEGRLKFEQWEAQDGTKRQAVEIIADTVQFLGSPRDESGEGGKSGEGGQYVPAGAATAASGAANDFTAPDDDIPF